MEYSSQKKDEITKKIIQLVENCSLNVDQDLTILDALFEKYGFKTISNFAKESGVSKSGIYKKAKGEEYPYKNLDGVIFVMSNLLK
jgi:predicted transcriptional regulator